MAPTMAKAWVIEPPESALAVLAIVHLVALTATMSLGRRQVNAKAGNDKEQRNAEGAIIEGVQKGVDEMVPAGHEPWHDDRIAFASTRIAHLEEAAAELTAGQGRPQAAVTVITQHPERGDGAGHVDDPQAFGVGHKISAATGLA
jgi:hypothetical protein